MDDQTQRLIRSDADDAGFVQLARSLWVKQSEIVEILELTQWGGVDDGVKVTLNNGREHVLSMSLRDLLGILAGHESFTGQENS